MTQEQQRNLYADKDSAVVMVKGLPSPFDPINQPDDPVKLVKIAQELSNQYHDAFYRNNNHILYIKGIQSDIKKFAESACRIINKDDISVSDMRNLKRYLYSIILAVDTANEELDEIQ